MEQGVKASKGQQQRQHLQDLWAEEVDEGSAKRCERMRGTAPVPTFAIFVGGGIERGRKVSASGGSEGYRANRASSVHVVARLQTVLCA